MNFLSKHSLLWRDTEFGKAWCWLVACHLLTRQEATHPVKWLFQDINCLLPFSRRGILSHFPRRPPQLKYHLFLFIYFWYLFVISLVSDFLSICPTHELCVYIKSWWGCERQRVRIVSPAVSKEVFLGRLQAGRCQQGQQPGPAPFPPLRLGGTAWERGATGSWGWRAHAEPWSRWTGWKWWLFPSRIQVAPCRGTQKQCHGACCGGMLRHVAVLDFS